MWASEHWETSPDIMCLAKGIAGGVPMGVTLVKPDILSVMKKGEHSSTFGGNPLSCSAGTATIQALTQDGLIDNAERLGQKFRQGLDALKSKHNIIREIRGKLVAFGDILEHFSAFQNFTQSGDRASASGRMKKIS